MIKIKVEGKSTTVVSKIVAHALREAGLKVSHWTEVKPREVTGCRRDASRQDADVSIVAMTK